VAGVWRFSDAARGLQMCSVHKQKSGIVMKPSYQSLHPARQLVVLLFFIVGVWYLNWRLDTFNDLHPIFSRLLYAAEISGSRPRCSMPS
jgi:hypothetical protein